MLDIHLTGYFSSPTVRKILRKGGLLSPQNQVVQPGYNPNIPKIYLPPLKTVQVHRRTADLGNLLKRLHSHQGLAPLRPSEEVPTSTARVSEPPGSKVSKKEKGAVRPLNHEEYEEMLKRFCEPQPTAESQPAPTSETAPQAEVNFAPAGESS